MENFPRNGLGGGGVEGDGVGVNDWVEYNGKMRKSRGRRKEWRQAGIVLCFSTPLESIDLKHVALPDESRRTLLPRALERPASSEPVQQLSEQPPTSLRQPHNIHTVVQERFNESDDPP